MQIKALTLALLATLASASAFPKQNWARSAKNDTAIAKTSPLEGASGIAAAAVGTGRSSIRASKPTAALGTAKPLGTGRPTGLVGTGNGFAGLNVSTTFIATVSSVKVATSTQTVQTTLLLVNGTKTAIIPTTLVVTRTNTVIVYFTKAPNGSQMPASTAKPVATTTPSIMLSLSESVSAKTITYTQGTGTATTVKTMTIQETRTLTVTKTIAGTTQNGQKGVATGAAGQNTETSNGDSTVTVKATRTNTVTLTKSTTLNSAGGSANNNQAGQLASSGTACSAAITKTVTEKSTVTVTLPAKTKSTKSGKSTKTKSAKSSKSTKKATSTKKPKPITTGTSGKGNGTAPGLPAAANGTLANAGSKANATATKLPASKGTAPASKSATSKPAASKSTAPAAEASTLEGSTAVLLSLATATEPPTSTLFAAGNIDSSAEATPSAYARLARRLEDRAAFWDEE